jgi:hypothetical protein
MNALIRNPSTVAITQRPSTVVRIHDHKAGAEACDFVGEAGEMYGIQHFVEILVGCRGLPFKF